jgi:hypothetical protein
MRLELDSQTAVAASAHFCGSARRLRPSILEATHFEHDKNQALDRQDGFPDN